MEARPSKGYDAYRLRDQHGRQWPGCRPTLDEAGYRLSASTATLPGFASRYVDRLLIEDIREDPKAAVEALIQAGEGQDRKGVIFPASDDAVQLLAHHERELSKHFHFNVPPEGVREAMVDKRLQYREAVRLGIPVPETCFPSGPDDLEMVAYTVRFPAFIKPLRSHKWCNLDNKGSRSRTPRSFGIR